MTESSQKISKDDSQQLPSIGNQQESQTNQYQNGNAQDVNNVLPLTHAKYILIQRRKKKKYRKKVRKHSPEYYEQIKVKKLNRKLEQKWDSHFINDQIPNINEKNRINRRTLSKLVDEKRSGTAFNSRAPANKTVELGVKKQTMPLPKIQNPNKRSKSFNIHVVTQKHSEAQNHQKREQQASLIYAKLEEPKHKKEKRVSQQAKQMVSENYLNQFTERLDDLFEEKKFIYCHKEMLQSFLEKIHKKNVKEMLEKEFNSLSKNQSIINKVIKAIQNRQKFLQQVQHAILNSNTNDKEILQIIDHYRTSTLAVVEQILKWKQTWQAIYFEIFKKTKIFDLIYKTQNYLLTLASSTDTILERFHKKQQNSQRQQKKIKQQKQQKIITKVKQQTLKSKQKQQNLNSQQKEKKKITDEKQLEKQQQIGEKLQTIQGEEKKLPLDIHKEGEYNSNYNLTPNLTKQAEKTKVHQPKQIQKPIIESKETQDKKIQNDLSNDPFLISLYGIYKEDKNIILKIRACELLLIQQQYNYLKK